MIRSVNVKKTKSSKKIVLKITMSMTLRLGDPSVRPFKTCGCSTHRHNLTFSGVQVNSAFNLSSVNQGTTYWQCPTGIG